MTSRVTVCSQFGESNFNSGGQALAGLITSTTTVKEFQEACRKYPNFSLNEGQRGSHILSCAAGTGNYKLVGYILTKLGKGTLNTGNNSGHTPLLLACDLPNRSAETLSLAYRTVEVLLQHGADPNIASAYVWKGRQGVIPAEATPLWVAVERTQNIQIVQLLLSFGAELGSCPLHHTNKPILARAQEDLNRYKQQLRNELSKNLLPPLAALVVDYVGSAGTLTQTTL